MDAPSGSEKVLCKCASHDAETHNAHSPLRHWHSPLRIGFARMLRSRIVQDDVAIAASG
jgi:hypothetical protein